MHYIYPTDDREELNLAKLFEEHSCAQKSYEERQRALEALQATCVREKVCAACGTAAGLYLAVKAAEALGFDKARFIALAERIWGDAELQGLENPAN